MFCLNGSSHFLSSMRLVWRSSLPCQPSLPGRGGHHPYPGYVSIQLVGIAAQAKFFPYHYGAVLPLAGLLAGWGLYKVYRISRAKWIFAVCFLLLTWGQLQWRPAFNPRETYWERYVMRFTSLFGDTETRHRINDYLHCEADVNAGADRKAAEWIANIPQPGQKSIFGGLNR